MNHCITQIDKTDDKFQLLHNRWWFSYCICVFQNVKHINDSFETIFEKYNDQKNFVFLDPPYDSEFTDYGYCNFGKEEHKKLAECFKNTKNKCLMIIGKTDFIVELYKDYIVEEYSKNYKFKIHSKRVGKEIDTMHLVIKNY